MQNEPFLESSWFSSMKLSVSQQAKTAQLLRQKLDAAGYKDTKLLAHDHNWANVDEGIKAYNSAKNAFDGIGMHCYKGKIDALKTISQQAPKAEIHSTECSSTATKSYQSNWTQLYWWLNSRFFPAVSMKSRSELLYREVVSIVLLTLLTLLYLESLSLSHTHYLSAAFILWNTALDSSYGPHWKQVFCENCKPSLTIDGSNVKVEAQSYAINHYSAASASTATIGGGRSHRVSVKKG